MTTLSSPSLYDEILNRIHCAREVMIVAHQKPDGDTVGSALAMSRYLQTKNILYTCFCVDSVGRHLRHVPGISRIHQDMKYWDPHRAQFDLLIVVDAGDLRHCGIDRLVQNLKHTFDIINIDHHATNTQFGRYNLVMSEASSTCEIMYDLFNHVQGIDAIIAKCLLTGMLTDTGGFRNLGTSARAIRIASCLMQQGVDFRSFSRQTLRDQRFSVLKVWGRALDRLVISSGGIAWTVIVKSDIDEFALHDDVKEGLANFLNVIDMKHTARMIMVFFDDGSGVIRVSLRTTHPLMDVSKIATLLGGGGHAKAAGFRLRGRLEKQEHQWKIKQTQ